VKLGRSGEAGIRPRPSAKSHDGPLKPATVLSVTKLKLWVIAGVMGAASVAAVPAISAQAYPPYNDYKVVVSPGSAPHTYIVKASGADPSCTFRVVSGNVHQNVPVNADGTATVTIDIGTKTGTRKILAKTISCHHKRQKTTTVTTTTNQIKAPSSAKKGELITFKALGWNPDYRVVITISNDKGPVKSKSLKPNSTGNVFWKVKTPAVGTYTVTFAQQGTQPQSRTMTILPKKTKKH
jgi:hypothetical protein